MKRKILEIFSVIVIVALLLLSISTLSFASETNINSSLEYNTEIQNDIAANDGVLPALEELQKQLENENLDNTKQNIINTETNLENQNEQLTNAQSSIAIVEELKTIEDVEERYNKLNEAYEKALKEIELANEELKNAKNNVNQAQQDFNSVQLNIDNSIEEIEEYSNNLEQLQEIQDQYYDLMVFYYRAYLGYGKNDVIYNEDGSVNLEASAQKMIEKNKVAQASSNIKKDIIPLGRYVTSLLAKYLVSQEENIDISSIQFGQDNEANEIMQPGILVKDKYGHDKVLLGNDTGAANKEDIYWHKVPGNTGRCNYVVVTYKKNNDEILYTMQFNYIIKNGSEGEEDISDGMFYLAEINEENGQISYKRIDNKNNLDSLSKIQEEINKILLAKERLKEYKTIKENIVTLNEKIKLLQEKINFFEGIDSDELQQLKDELDKAKEALKIIQTKEEVIEKELINVQKVNSIIKINNDIKLIGEDNQIDLSEPLNLNISTLIPNTINDKTIEENVIIENDKIPLAGSEELDYINLLVIFLIVLFIVIIFIILTIIIYRKDAEDQSEE